ncbi:MAG: hemolysin C [Rhodospirillales bacterium 69-11]|nr:HlyC/CorC family transporter [Rhodospirillales bacterium]OJW23113.1 MAG: hemolysin C [Rhodospirillales bacterium 69-11]
MSIGIEVFVILLLIVVNGLFSMSELALVSVRRARLAVLERKGVQGAAAARALADDPQRFLPTVQVGITLVGVLTGVFGGARIAGHLQAWFETMPTVAPFAQTLSLALVVVLTTYLTLVLGELVPKHLALRRPEEVASRVARPITLMARLTAPAVWVLGWSSTLILRLFGMQRAAEQSVTEEELRALLAEGAQAGVLEIEERDMIERVLRLADKPVRAIMTPRTELAWIDRTDPPKEIAAALKAAPHSRFVVCEGSVDNVVGVVQAKDLLDRILGGSELSVGAALRQPIVVPDTVTALDALERLKADPLGLALVMDEYGSFEGVVTAADVLEAIVGDPSDTAGSATGAGQTGETSLTMDGMMPVDELKARLALPDLPAEGSYHTLAGLVLALLRRVPRVGDRIVFAGWRFEVLAMDGRRVDKVRADREPVPDADAAARLSPAPTSAADG